MVANVIGVKKPPWMEVDQWWRHWHRTGDHCIEKCDVNILTASRKRALSWGGHVASMDYKEVCVKAKRCRGLQVVEMPTAPLERIAEGQMVWSAPTAFQNLQVGGHGGDGGFQTRWNADGLSESVQNNTGLLHLARNRVS